MTEQPVQQPANILWIITDDQQRATFTAGRMPKVFSRLVGQGVRFSKGYVAVPLCGPSRASFLTSRYSHNHGAHTNMTWPPFHEAGHDQDTISTRLKAAGYDTGYFGKYMNGISAPVGGDERHVAPGYDRWVNVLGDKAREVTIDGGPVQTVNNPVDNVSAYHLRNWLGNRSTDKPWFAVWSACNPHSAYTPSDKHAHDFDNASWRPDSFNEHNMGDKPEWLHGIPKQSEAEMDAGWEGKLEELQDTDDLIGTIFDALNNTGMMANTYIFFISDNGYLLGEHRLFKKEYAYEECSNIPFAVRGPGITAGQVDDHFVNTVDLMPTSLEIAGLDPDEGRELDGRSFLQPLLSGDWCDWRKRMLVEYTNPNRGWAMLCDQNMRFIDHVYRPGANGAWELYDLSSDPAQMQSLNGQDPAPYRQVLDQLRVASGKALRDLEV